MDTHVVALSGVRFFCNPMDYSLPGSVHKISQGRTLDWVAISSSRGSSQPRDQTCISSVSKWILGKPQWVPIIMIRLTVWSAGYLSWPIPAPQDVCGFSIFTSPRLSGPWSYMNCPPDGSGTWLVFSVAVLAFLSIAWTTATVSYLVSLLLVLLSCQPVPHTSAGCSF